MRDRVKPTNEQKRFIQNECKKYAKYLENKIFYTGVGRIPNHVLNEREFFYGYYVGYFEANLNVQLKMNFGVNITDIDMDDILAPLFDVFHDLTFKGDTK